MTRFNSSIFPRHFVGFDSLLNELELAQSDNNYPPYNIIKHSDISYSVEIAVAGFSDEDLEITVDDRDLLVKATKQKGADAEYLHKGISTKAFTRNFRLAEHVQVTGADLSNGMLSISLEVVVPEEKKPKLIEIGTGKQQSLDFIQD